MKKINLKNLITEHGDSNDPNGENNYLTYKDVAKLKDIRGYSVDGPDMAGTIGWYKKGQDSLLYATPSWDGNWGWVPFDDEEGHHFGELDFSKNPKKYKGNKKLQLKAYISAVGIALKKLDMRVEKELNRK